MTSDYRDRLRFVGSYLAKVALLSAAYFATGKLGLMLAVPPGYATIIWPPSGIAIGALLLFGRSVWPGVFIGSLLLNCGVGTEELALSETHLGELLVASGIGAGSTLQAFVAWAIVTRLFGSSIGLKDWHDVLRLFGSAGPLSCIIAASVGTMTLYVSGAIGTGALADNWTTWWLGDTLGVLVFLPLALVGLGNTRRLSWRGHSIGVLPSAALVVIMLPLGMTLFAWQITTEYNFDKSHSLFASLANENEKALINRLSTYEQGLRGGGGFFSAVDTMSREKWRTYVENLDLDARYPGINGIGYIADLKRLDDVQFMAAERQDGAPEFDIHPEKVERGRFIITYIEPIADNREALGLNIAFEKSRYEAAVHARDSGLATITRRILLVQDSTKSPGFLLLQALYRKGLPIDTMEQRQAAFMGWIYAPFVGRSFMADLTPSQGETLHLKVYDGTTIDDGDLIFSSEPAAVRATMAPEFTVRHKLKIMQKTWTLEWTSTPEFERVTASNEPKLILGGGLLFTMLFGTLLLFFARRAETVRRLVALKTREIEAGEERFRLAMEYASIGMGVVDIDGRWLQLNPSLRDLLGYDKDALIGKDFRDALHPEDREAGQEDFCEILAGESTGCQVEMRYLHSSGRAIWALVNLSLARNADGSPRYFIVQIQDITDRKEMDRVKSEFVSTVSHELRTPLTAIRGSLGIILQAMTDDIPPKANRLLNIAHNNCDRLIHLINDILDIEKIASGRMRFEMKLEDLASLVEQSIEGNQSYAERFNVSYVATSLTSAVVNIDADRMMQVLANLLSNAAKFSPADSEVEISLDVVGGQARLSVRDHGAGIPEDFRSLIFTRFSQADSSATRAKGGTGLGLNITKQIVEQMGGEIGFETEVDQGTVFWVTFPEAIASINDALAGTAGPISVDGRMLPTILHVEDDADLCHFLAVALHEKAYILRATCLEEARALLKTHSFSLIVLDQGLPDGTGLSLLDDFEGRPEDMRPPVVILSADEISDETRKRVVAALVKSRVPETQIVESIMRLAS